MDGNSMFSKPRQAFRAMPMRVSLLYFVISCLYIFFSDRVLSILFTTMPAYQQAQTYKGWGFVIATTALLYFALRNEHRQIDQINQKLEAERIKLQNTVEQLEEAYQEVRQLAQRCSQVEEVERRRLADELHDRVGQTLTAMNLNLRILQSSLPEDTPATVFERINQTRTLIQEAAGQIRDVIAELHPPILDDYGLVEALKYLGERFEKRFEMPLTVDCDENLERLPSSVEVAFYRVAQSALDNIVRHAKATQISLSLRQDLDGVALCVQDNGVGFDPEEVLKSKEYPTWGVKIMRERMLAVGGRFWIESQKGHGTKVMASWKEGGLK